MQARLGLVFPSEAFDSVTSNPLAAAAVAAMIYVADDRHAITTVRVHQRATLGGGPLRSEPAVDFLPAVNSRDSNYAAGAR